MGGEYHVWDREHPRYPPALASIPTAPERLYAAGNAAVLDCVAIAVVGTRSASPSSLDLAHRIGQTLAAAGACVVSGLALGIDAAAHAGALEAPGGRTCAVLGGGLAVGGPATNRRLERRIAARGLLLSEWEPDTTPLSWRFPLRNRIIAGLARATVVVEAGPESGALITAGFAAEFDRLVAVVPGPIDTDRFLGSNRLLQDEGTAVIAQVEDVLALLGVRTEVAPAPPQFRDDEAKVWDTLAAGALDVDRIAIRSHLPMTRCLAAITALELAGAISCDLTGDIRRR